MSPQLTSRRTRTPLLKAATRSALSSTGQYLGEATVKVLGPTGDPPARSCQEGACARWQSVPQPPGYRPPPDPPGRAAEARGGEILHHRHVDEPPGRRHHCQQSGQVPGAAVGAERGRRCLCGGTGPRGHGACAEPLGSWTCDPTVHPPPRIWAPGGNQEAPAGELGGRSGRPWLLREAAPRWARLRHPLQECALL